MSGSEGGGFFGVSPPTPSFHPRRSPLRRSQALLGNALARSSASHFSDLTPDFWVRLRWGGAKQSLAGRIPKQSLGTTGLGDSFRRSQALLGNALARSSASHFSDLTPDFWVRLRWGGAKQSLAGRIPKQSLGTTRGTTGLGDSFRRSQALLGNALARSSASHFSDLTPDFWVRLRWGGAKQSLAGRIPKQSLGTTGIWGFGV